MAAVAAAAGWWQTASTPVALNTGKVADSIQASILSQRHLHAAVSCPDNVIQKAGVVFECTATVGGHRFAVYVTQTDGDGHVVFVVA